MKALSLMFAAVLGVFAVVGNAEASVLRVVVVETSDPVAYMKDLDKVRAIQERLGNKETIRAWRARFAGEGAGRVVVAIEFADMAAFAASDGRMSADAEMQGLLKAMGSNRKILSDSLYEEMK